MRLLLDSHTLVCLLEADAQLPIRTLTFIEQAEAVSVSIVSFWELAIKANLKKKLTLGKLLRVYYDSVLKLDFQLLTPGLDEVEIIQSLHLHHRDPFDRMLIA